MANNSVASNTSGLRSEWISLLIILDGVSALFISFVFYLEIQMSDYFSDYQRIGVMMEQRVNFVMWLAFGYLLICIISLIYARRRKRLGAIILACLAAFHTFGIVLWQSLNSDYLATDWLTLVVYVSLLINLGLLFLIYRNNIFDPLKTG